MPVRPLPDVYVGAVTRYSLGLSMMIGHLLEHLRVAEALLDTGGEEDIPTAELDASILHAITFLQSPTQQLVIASDMDTVREHARWLAEQGRLYLKAVHTAAEPSCPADTDFVGSFGRTVEPLPPAEDHYDVLPGWVSGPGAFVADDELEWELHGETGTMVGWVRGKDDRWFWTAFAIPHNPGEASSWTGDPELTPIAAMRACEARRAPKTPTLTPAPPRTEAPDYKALVAEMATEAPVGELGPTLGAPPRTEGPPFVAMDITSGRVVPDPEPAPSRTGTPPGWPVTSEDADRFDVRPEIRERAVQVTVVSINDQPVDGPAWTTSEDGTHTPEVVPDGETPEVNDDWRF